MFKDWYYCVKPHAEASWRCATDLPSLMRRVRRTLEARYGAEWAAQHQPLPQAQQQAELRTQAQAQQTLSRGRRQRKDNG